MLKLLTTILFAVLPSLAQALINRLLRSPAPEPKTADSALLDVAKDTQKVQHEINDINAASLSVPDAIARLRDRAANKNSDGL